MLNRVLCLLAGMTAFSGAVAAQTINLEPTNKFFGPTYTQDGYDFTADIRSGEASSAALFSEKYFEANGWDADAPGSDVGENYGELPVTISKSGGGTFNFRGINLTGIYNDGGSAGGVVDFTFNHQNGTTSTASVTIGTGYGFDAYTFRQTGLTSVTFTPEQSAFALQFDYVKVDTSVGAVPLPASAPMFGASLLALGAVGYGLIFSTSQHNMRPWFTLRAFLYARKRTC